MIPSIPTLYNGIEYRSRTEARWAVFFDKINITHVYEIEGLKTDQGNYLPDFYLPDYDAFAEVKPTYNFVHQPVHMNRYKCFQEHDQPLILLVGSPNLKPTLVFSSWNADASFAFIPFSDKVRSKYGGYFSTGKSYGTEVELFYFPDHIRKAIFEATNHKFNDHRLW